MGNRLRKGRERVSRNKKRPANTLEPGSRVEHDMRHRVAHLEAELATARALDPVNGLPESSRQVVRSLIRTLTVLEEAADPTRGHPIETQMRYRHPDSTVDEGASTRWARAMLRRIHVQVAGFANEYERRAAGQFKEVVEPRVRCRNPKCEAAEKRLPKYITTGRSKIEMSSCPRCQLPLSPAP